MIDPADEIARYLKDGHRGKPLSQIRQEIADFVKERDKHEATSTYQPYRTDPSYFVREGKVIYRDKIKKCECMGKHETCIMCGYIE